MSSKSPSQPAGSNVRPGISVERLPSAGERTPLRQSRFVPDRPRKGLAAILQREPELMGALIEGADTSPRQRAEILAAVREAIRNATDYADVCYFAALAEYRLGEPERAADLVARAIELNPGYHDALLLAAKIAMNAGKPRDARQTLDRLIACGGDYPDVYLLHGQAQQELGNVPAARRSYQRALAMRASFAAARKALQSLPTNDSARGAS